MVCLLKASRREGGRSLTGAPATSQMVDRMEEQATAPLTAAHGRRCGGGRDSRPGEETDETEVQATLGEGLLYNGSNGGSS